jgi:hypothetical protein
MGNMRTLVSGLIVLMSGSLLLSPLLEKGRGGRATYLGGTVAAPSSRADGAIDTTDQQHFVFQAKSLTIRVPYARINLLEYGQKVNRRYAMAVLVSPILLLSKARRHYLTVAYLDPEGRQQALVFQVNKDDVRSVLVALEVKTGLRVQFQDEEARKAGKG